MDRFHFQYLEAFVLIMKLLKESVRHFLFSLVWKMTCDNFLRIREFGAETYREKCKSFDGEG